MCLYNLIDLDKDEKEITFHVMNYLLGSGGLTSKLYQYLRENNGYCYQVSSLYFKYDNLLCITSSMQRKNVDNAIKLINKAIKEMQEGKFTDDDLNDAKKNLILSLEVNLNNQNAILASYEFNVFLENYLPEKKIEKIKNLTKQDIINVAKKIKDNLVYIMCEGQSEED